MMEFSSARAPAFSGNEVRRRGMKKKVSLPCRFSRRACACLFVMKKHLITLIIAASAVIHAQSAELASQLEGYWQPDMEKTLALAKKANRELDPMTQAMMGKMVFEFQKRGNPVNAVLDTLVVKPDAGSAEYIFPIPQGLGEIRVFGVGSRMDKNPALWDDIHETFTQYFTVAHTDDRISQVVTAHLQDGVLAFFGTSINAMGDSRPMPLTETLRNQIQADIAANKRTVPIFLREKSRPGSLHGRTNRVPVESIHGNKES
jgi:hypothetical protein